MDIKYIHDEFTHNTAAAKEILPKVFELFPVNSILDVGCGIGTWLKAAEELGKSDILGIDGDYVDRSLLKIEEKKFQSLDLSKGFSLIRSFDLVICLEVAEHLPDVSAENFVSSIANHADVVLFSAAIPFQGGQNHINEQWTTSYWSTLFAKYGFFEADLLRHHFWNNNKVDWWYKQNMLFYLKKDTYQGQHNMNKPFLDAVHPELYLHKQKEAEQTLRNQLAEIKNGGMLTINDLVKIVFKKIKRKVGAKSK